MTSSCNAMTVRMSEKKKNFVKEFQNRHGSVVRYSPAKQRVWVQVLLDPVDISFVMSHNSD